VRSKREEEEDDDGVKNVEDVVDVTLAKANKQVDAVALVVEIGVSCRVVRRWRDPDGDPDGEDDHVVDGFFFGL